VSFGTSGGIGFTKANELFVGRVAMIGFAASLLGEALTGTGILAQLNLGTVHISELINFVESKVLSKIKEEPNEREKRILLRC
jgi:uncharacterized protein YaiE (UPF0345 family)